MTSHKTISPDNGLAEIDAIANGKTMPLFEMDQDTINAVQTSWAMFVQHKGGLEEAEEAVMRKLQKVEPDFAVILYGDTARPHKAKDDGTGLLVDSRAEETVTYNGVEGRRHMAAIVKAGQPPMDGYNSCPAGFGQEGAGLPEGGMAAVLAAMQAAGSFQGQAQGAHTKQVKAKSKSARAKSRGAKKARASNASPSESPLGLTEPSAPTPSDSIKLEPAAEEHAWSQPLLSTRSC
mmetsp:Transcript_30770/g.55841  ORF Transcript_30770/g.55841 Transcript_30770/m.55841 type:complete len:235 (+) Transcript_30770:61-765(+)